MLKKSVVDIYANVFVKKKKLSKIFQPWANLCYIKNKRIKKIKR